MLKVQQIDYSKVSSIQQLPHGQLICGKHKKVVYIEQDVVYKGPFRMDQAGYNNNLKYSLALNLLENISKLDANKRAFLRIETILKYDKDNLYLVFKNIGNKSLLKTSNIQKKSSKLETNVPIYPR